jgi:hypothetical protein
MASSSAPSECANCGGSIPPAAHACPACGADEATGWRETDLYDGLDLPDEAWSDSPPEPTPSAEISWYWWATGLGLFVALVLTVLGLR